MIITHHNIQFFKIQLGDTIIAFNPISKDSKFKGSRFGADITLITLNDKDFNGVEAVSSKNKEPFVISGPGEYEVQGVMIRGAASDSHFDGKSKINTVYSLSLEGINIGFLGSIKSSDLSDAVKKILGEVDVLFVPIGGEGTLTPAEANKVATKLGAKIIIPMHYGEVGEKDALDKFLKESGFEKLKPVEKLTIKKKDVDSAEGEVIVLSAN